ncbi:hypothetical protein RA210_U150017 [Rubrivivax sp. A210]|nr:hypothetical protein RA210_U150017 [Rubrivivax sp. A210]
MGRRKLDNTQASAGRAQRARIQD